MASNSDKRFQSIPATEHYQGLVKRRIKGTDKGITVLGWGEEAELVAEAALAKALEARDVRLKEEIDE